jgi:hypothetical protein
MTGKEPKIHKLFADKFVFLDLIDEIPMTCQVQTVNMKTPLTIMFRKDAKQLYKFYGSFKFKVPSLTKSEF